MFNYNLSVINDMFDPGTALLYDSSNSNIKIFCNSIEDFLWNPSDFSSDVIFENLCFLWIVFIKSVFQVPPQKIIKRLRSGEWADQGLLVRPEISLSPEKYCLRY